jgi:hypothetical protein
LAKINSHERFVSCGKRKEKNMKYIDMDDFLEKKSKENKRFNEIDERRRVLGKIRRERNSSEYDELDKEWFSLSDERHSIKNEYQKKYEDGVFYTLKTPYLDIFRIGHCGNDFYIIYSGDGEQNCGDPMIFFKNKNELMSYLNLNELEKFLLLI